MSSLVYGTLMREFNNRLSNVESKVGPGFASPPPHIQQSAPDISSIVDTVMAKVTEHTVKTSGEIADVKRNITNALTIKMESMLQSAVSDLQGKLNKQEALINKLQNDIAQFDNKLVAIQEKIVELPPPPPTPSVPVATDSSIPEVLVACKLEPLVHAVPDVAPIEDNVQTFINAMNEVDAIPDDFNIELTQKKNKIKNKR